MSGESKASVSRSTGNAVLLTLVIVLSVSFVATGSAIGTGQAAQDADPQITVEVTTTKGDQEVTNVAPGQEVEVEVTYSGLDPDDGYLKIVDRDATYAGSEKLGGGYVTSSSGTQTFTVSRSELKDAQEFAEGENIEVTAFYLADGAYDPTVDEESNKHDVGFVDTTAYIQDPPDSILDGESAVLDVYGWTGQSSVTLNSMEYDPTSFDELMTFTSTDVTNNYFETSILAPSRYADGSNNALETYIELDNGAKTDTYTIDVVQNDPPEIFPPAASPNPAEEGDRVFVAASATDPNGHDIDYEWEQLSGPGVTIQDRFTSEPEFVAPEVVSERTVELQVTATDELGASSTATIKIDIEPVNQAPDADAGESYSVDEGGSVSLDSSESSDSDGRIDETTWTITSGPGSISGGTYYAPSSVSSNKTATVELTVTDNEGASDTDTATITIRHLNEPPNADAGGPYSVDEGDSVSLDSSGSSDPDGSISSTSWSVVDGPGSVSGGVYIAPSDMTSDDTVTLELTVTDDDGETDTDTTTVDVNHVNEPPTADAGGPYSVAEGGSVNLDASGSTDSDGQIADTSWSVVSGSGSISSGTYYAPDDITGDQSATVRVTVTDNDGATDTAKVTVSISDNNQPPTADAGGPYSVAEGGSVNLDASGSTDSDGQIVDTSWTVADGPGSVSGGTYYAPDSMSSDDTATVELTVTDDDGASATDKATINLENNTPPSADFTYSPSNPQVGDTVSFNENASDPDGSVQSYKWEFGDGSTSSDANPSHTYNSSGNYDVTLTITDDDDNTESTTKTIAIGSNSPPSAKFSYSPSTPTVDEPITFAASQSTDPDNDIQSYEWDFNSDGTVDKKGQQVTHTYDNTGDYDVTLTVSDSSSETNDATITKTVSVISTDENTGPTADASGPYSVTAGNTITLDSSNSTDSDGVIVSTSWQITDGPGSVSDGTYTAPPTVDSETTAMIKLTVTDDDNATDTDIASVNVERQDLPEGDNQIYRLPFARNEQKLSDGFKSTLRITAQQPNTSVEVDYGATGTIDTTRTLTSDETASFSQPPAGTIVTSSAPVKVTYRYTSADFSAFEDGKYKYGIPEASELGTEYYAPMAADSLNVAATTDTEIRADTDGDGNTEESITLNANETATFTEIAAGAHIVADEPIHAVLTNARWSNMDNTYAASLLPVSAAQSSYDLPGHPSYNVKDSTDKTRVALVATQDGTKVDVGNQTVKMANGEVKSVQTSANTTVEADAPVVALYAIHVTGQDWWNSAYREFIGVGTPVDEFKINAGEWNGKHFDNGLTAWSTYNIDTSSKAPIAVFNVSSQSPAVSESVTFNAEQSSLSSGEIIRYEWDFDGDDTTDATGVTTTHDFESAGEHNVTLTITDDTGTTDTVTKSITVTESSGNGASVTLDPNPVSIPSGGTSSVDVVIDNAGDIAVYDFDLALTGSPNVQITGITLNGDPGFKNITTSSDAQSASVDAATASINGTDAAVIASIELSGRDAGDATLEAIVNNLGDLEGDGYRISNGTATTTVVVEAGPGDVTGNGNAATDPDNDGVYEDVNGDGSANVLDVQSLFGNLDSDDVSGNAAFDMNGDGGINILDVQTLFYDL